MTTTEIAGVYIAVNILLLIYLAIRVVGRRFSTKTSLGHVGDEKLELAVRVHGNATEYIPMAMIGLFVGAFLGLPVIAVHVLGGAFTLARLMHAFGFATGTLIFRQMGALLTWISMLAIAGGLLWQALV